MIHRYHVKSGKWLDPFEVPHSSVYEGILYCSWESFNGVITMWKVQASKYGIVFDNVVPPNTTPFKAETLHKYTFPASANYAYWMNWMFDKGTLGNTTPSTSISLTLILYSVNNVRMPKCECHPVKLPVCRCRLTALLYSLVRCRCRVNMIE